MLKLKPAIVIRTDAAVVSMSYIDGDTLFSTTMNTRRGEYKKLGLNVLTGASFFVDYTEPGPEETTEMINTRECRLVQVAILGAASRNVSSDGLYQNLKLLGADLQDVKMIRTYVGGLCIKVQDHLITFEEFVRSYCNVEPHE